MKGMILEPGGTRYFGIGDDYVRFFAESSAGVLIRQHPLPEPGITVVCIGLSEYWGSKPLNEKKQLLNEMFTLLPFDELTKLYGPRIHPGMIGIGYCQMSQHELVLGLKTFNEASVSDLLEIQRTTSQRFLEKMGFPSIDSIADENFDLENN
ncbi:MAG: hypothetical protein AABX51_04775 [Nanoarchaeota archaeon]